MFSLYLFFGRQLSGFFFQHYRDVIAYWIGETIRFAYQFLVFLIVFQRPLADRAGEYIE